MNNFSNLRFFNSLLKVFNGGEQEGEGSLKRKGKDEYKEGWVNIVWKGLVNLKSGWGKKNNSKRNFSKKGITKGGGLWPWTKLFDLHVMIMGSSYEVNFFQSGLNKLNKLAGVKSSTAFQYLH